jgi:hypothetical protein
MNESFKLRSNLSVANHKAKGAKGVDPLISTILVIAIIVVIAGLLGPWAMNLGRRSVNNTGSGVNSQITCQSTSYDFDSSYGNGGVDWDFSGSSDWLRARIINTGTVNLYGFSFQLYIEGTGYKFFPTKNQISPDRPLKPGESAVIEADITEDLAGQMTETRVTNGVCTSFSIAQEF